MAKKSKGVKKSGKNRSSRKIIDAYQIAEKQERKNHPRDFDDDESDNDVPFEEGILDARKFLNDGQQDEDLLDEEIDSDEALASDDDYDVLNSKFSQTIRDKTKRRKLGQDSDSESEIDVDDEDAYDSIDEGQLVTLSEAWDMDDRDFAQVKGSKESNELVLNDEWESESSSSGDDESGDDEDDEAADEVEEDWGDTTKASTSDSESESEEDESDSEDVFAHESDDEDDEVDLVKTTGMLKKELESSKPKERKKFVAETRTENEFSVPSNGQKLSLSDMMKDVSGVDNILIDQDAKAVVTPLPKRIQQRNDRGAAYELAKKEVSKWSDTVQQNRQAEVLKFPMQQPDQINDSALTFRADNHTPTTNLEKKVNDLLTQSALVDDKKEATFEEIAMAKMSPEEMRKRTNELRLMRELMFRDERRAKRLKKIKSKQYHKIKKRERLRNQELGDEAEDIDGEEEDHDMERAKERMSLKHKTQSKWAQSMIKSGLSKDVSNREELEEMLRQGERLREKQLGRKGGEDDDDEGFYSDDNLDRLEREYAKDGEDINRSKIGKGVMAMDFMKNAEKRKKEENLKQIEHLRRLENGEDTGIDLFEEDNGLVNVKKNTGRRVYNAAAIDDTDLNEEIRNEVVDDNAKSLDAKINKVQVIEKEAKDDGKDKAKVEKIQVDESNPWLASSTSTSTSYNDTRQKSSKITTVIDENSSKLAKAAAKIAKRKQKHHNDTESLIDVNNTLAISEVQKGEDDSDEGEDIDTDSVPTMFKQKELIKEAFIGDDVTSEFQQEKKRMIEDEDNKEEDATLPGWGDWTGGSTKGNKNKKRKFIRKIDGVTQRDKRKDKNLSNVIINEKLNKKILKYQSSDVPYPFETREQYERSLRMPLGQEWTSRETHQKLTMPRVITKQGVVIDPLKAPFK